jgi:hypothetical protein
MRYQRLFKDGKALETAEENLADFNAQEEALYGEALPMRTALQIVLPVPVSHAFLPRTRPIPQITESGTVYDEDALRDAEKVQLGGPARDQMCI